MIQKKIAALASKRATCDSKTGRPQTSLNHYWTAFDHIAKRLNEKAATLEANRTAAAKRAKHQVIHSLSGLFLLMVACVGRHIASVRAIVDNGSSTDLHMLHSSDDELRDIVSGHCILADAQLDVGRIFSTPDVRLPPWIDAAPDGGTFATPTTKEIEAASSSRFKNCSKTVQKHCTKLCKVSTMRIQTDATKAFSDDLPFIDLEGDLEKIFWCYVNVNVVSRLFRKFSS